MLLKTKGLSWRLGRHSSLSPFPLIIGSKRVELRRHIDGGSGDGGGVKINRGAVVGEAPWSSFFEMPVHYLGGGDVV